MVHCCSLLNASNCCCCHSCCRLLSLNNTQEGNFCYQKLQTALPVTAFFLRVLSNFNHNSGFTEHHFTGFCAALCVGGLANICAVPILGFWLYGKSIRRDKRMFNLTWNSKEQLTSLPLILSLWEQMDSSVLLQSSSEVAKADSQNKMRLTHEPQNILIN